MPFFSFLERVCCLLVLNLVSSTLSCISQPRPEHVSLFEVVDAQSSQLPLEQLRTLHLHQRVLDAGVDLPHAPRSGALLF